MMSTEEQEKQEKILSKLSWMNERAQLDFRGNPPPFEEAKTMQSVAKQRRLNMRELAGDGEFKPFWHTPIPLAEDATRTDYLKGFQNEKFELRLRERSHCASHQRTDPETGLKEVQAALCWNAPVLYPSAKGVCHRCCAATDCCGAHKAPAGNPPRHRLDPQHLNTLPPQERAAAFREEILAHPMNTREGVEAHGERWRRGTQLTDPISPPPPRKRNAERAVDRRNLARTVAYQRAKQQPISVAFSVKETHHGLR